MRFIDRLFPVRTLKRLQDRERRFVSIVGIKDTPQSLKPQIDGELEELNKATEKWEIGCEIADAIILLTRRATAEGLDVERIINQKMLRNQDKYPPRRLRRLQTDWGFTPDEAMAFAKARWDRERDRQYFDSQPQITP